MFMTQFLPKNAIGYFLAMNRDTCWRIDPDTHFAV